MSRLVVFLIRVVVALSSIRVVFELDFILVPVLFFVVGLVLSLSHALSFSDCLSFSLTPYLFVVDFVISLVTPRLLEIACPSSSHSSPLTILISVPLPRKIF